jgi:FkbM family methyltransferase
MDELEELLAESVESAKARQADEFDRMAQGRPIVLFGAGGLGKRTLRGLRQLGMEPLAFCDNNSGLWGRDIEGVPVLSLSEASQLHGADSAFVITIWSGRATDRMADRERQLRAAGCQTVLQWGPLYWKHPETLFPHYAANSAHHLLEQADDVRACLDLWADEDSKREYLSQVRWRLYFDFNALAGPVPGPIYFRDELRPLSNREVFVDCGAYDGDTVLSFLDHSRHAFEHVFAFEPDPANFAKLSENVRSLPREEQDKITLQQAAVGRRACKVPFSGDGNEASAVGSGELQVDCIALDEYLDGAAPRKKPSFIKMDIEGFEPEALAGAQKTIERDAPVLAVCSYHAQDHLWKIPLQIHQYNPGYRFYLRPHLVDVWDLVCYAIPK